MPSWNVTTPPAAAVATWSQAAAHLRIDDAAEQAVVEGFVAAAADYAAEAMDCSLVVQTITATFYAGEPVRLPRGPLVSIVSITDAGGNEIADYEVRQVGTADVVSIDVPAAAPLTVVYTAGYPGGVPAAIRTAILCHAGTLYECRESTTDRPRSEVPHQLAAFYRQRRRSVGAA